MVMEIDFSLIETNQSSLKAYFKMDDLLWKLHEQLREQGYETGTDEVLGTFMGKGLDVERIAIEITGLPNEI